MGKRTAFNPLGAFEDGGTVTRERVLRKVRYWRFAISKRRLRKRGTGGRTGCAAVAPALDSALPRMARGRRRVLSGHART